MLAKDVHPFFADREFSIPNLKLKAMVYVNPKNPKDQAVEVFKHK